MVYFYRLSTTYHSFKISHFIADLKSIFLPWNHDYILYSQSFIILLSTYNFLLSMWLSSSNNTENFILTLVFVKKQMPLCVCIYFNYLFLHQNHIVLNAVALQ